MQTQPPTLSLDDLPSKLNDPTWVAPQIVWAIEALEEYLPALLPARWGLGPKFSGTAKVRMAAGMSLGAPVAGRLLPAFTGAPGANVEWWQWLGAILLAVVTGVANFLFSTKFHDLMTGQLGQKTESPETQTTTTTTTKKGAK